jgi:hypothetical protein
MTMANGNSILIRGTEKSLIHVSGLSARKISFASLSLDSHWYFVQERKSDAMLPENKRYSGRFALRETLSRCEKLCADEIMMMYDPVELRGRSASEQAALKYPRCISHYWHEELLIVSEKRRKKKHGHLRCLLDNLPVFLAQAAHFLRVVSDGLMISSISALGRVTAMTFSCTQTVIGKFGAIAKRVPKIVKAQTSMIATSRASIRSLLPI